MAFSRRTVLGLKADLEKKFNRSVAVVYGNLPPEVRLRQAERFASGEAEICVATDAIGMGLNLPADNVCFYEVEKFDGKNMRVLNPNEIKQIAGRAGRFGLSEQGMVGALSKANLNIIRQSIEAQNTRHRVCVCRADARVAGAAPRHPGRKAAPVDDAQRHSGTMAAAAETGRPV